MKTSVGKKLIMLSNWEGKRFHFWRLKSRERIYFQHLIKPKIMCGNIKKMEAVKSHSFFQAMVRLFFGRTLELIHCQSELKNFLLLLNLKNSLILKQGSFSAISEIINELPFHKFLDQFSQVAQRCIFKWLQPQVRRL